MPVQQAGSEALAVVTFSEFEYWSAIHGEDVVRVSVTDANGSEFFAIVPLDGRVYRKRRDEAIELCLEAIRLGCAPGEVRAR